MYEKKNKIQKKTPHHNKNPKTQTKNLHNKFL